jgi:GNAT superfamily N-acetyltransferase
LEVGDMEIEHVTEFAPEADKLLRSRSSGALRRARKAKPGETHWLISRNGDGSVIAGCRAELWQGWLSIQALWVDPAERGKGCGSQFLSRVEALARAEGAKGLDAMLYAAEGADFFLKRGYVSIGEIEGQDAGMKRMWLVNSFQALPAVQPAAKPDARRAKRTARTTSALAATKRERK